MKLGTVWFDDTEYVPALLSPLTWNGWAKPVLLRMNAESLFPGQTQFTDAGCLILDEIDPEDLSKAKLAPMITIENSTEELNGLPAYDFRELGYCFSEGPDY